MTRAGAAREPLAHDLVRLAVVPQRRPVPVPSLDTLLRAAQLADLVLSGNPLPADVARALRDSEATITVPEAVDRLDAGRRAALVATLTTGLRHASTLPLRLGFLAALASAGGIASTVLSGEEQEAAADLASGVIELVADPTSAIPTLADGVREVLSSPR